MIFANQSILIVIIVTRMNRILGFFKQKITQVKQQNKQQIQAIANALTQNQYSTEKVLGLLQSMKASYMNWNILIANQASTGLYYSQLHNRNICLRKIKGNQDLRRHLDKNKMKLTHIKDTAEQLKQMGQLNNKWMANVTAHIEGINQYVFYVDSKIKEKYNSRKLAMAEQQSHKQQIAQNNEQIAQTKQQVNNQQQAQQAKQAKQNKQQIEQESGQPKPKQETVNIQQIIDDQSQLP